MHTVSGRQVLECDRQCGVHAVWSRNILGFDGCDGCVDLPGLSGRYLVAYLE